MGSIIMILASKRVINSSISGDSRDNFSCFSSMDFIREKSAPSFCRRGFITFFLEFFAFWIIAVHGGKGSAFGKACPVVSAAMTAWER